MKQLHIFESFEHGSVTQKEHNSWKIFVDGASRKNPGPSGAGIVIYKNDKLHDKKGFFLGTKTNNQAEYLALLLALLLVQSQVEKQDTIEIISDSQLLVKQFKGEYKIKHPELKPLHIFAKTMLEPFTYRIDHVMREDNTQADSMANSGIDERHCVPPAFVKVLSQHGITL